MILAVKKRITTQKPVKAFKVLCITPEDGAFTGPFRLEHVKEDEWVTSTGVGYIGYHAFKSLNMANRGLYYMARRGQLSYHGYPHIVVPVYLRGLVEFGTYVSAFKGVRGEQMLIKSKHVPTKYHSDAYLKVSAQGANI